MDRLGDIVIALLVVYGMLMLSKQFSHWIYLKGLSKSTTTVSWVLLVENQEREIEGLLRQLMEIYREDHLISDFFVIDQGSGDATVEIARRLGKNNREFVVVENSRDSSWDAIIDRCKGQAICILDLKEVGAANLPDVALRITQKASFKKQHMEKKSV